MVFGVALDPRERNRKTAAALRDRRHASLPSGRVRSGAGDLLTQRRTPPAGTPVWIIYSGCIPGNFRGAVLRWLRSFIAASPPFLFPLLPPVFLPSPLPPLPSVFSPRFAFSSVDLVSSFSPAAFTTAGLVLLSSRFSSPLALLFSFAATLATFVFTRCSGTRRYTRAGLICAQRERHELMHVAHAGRESVGSLSSRTPALTRIHHRATLRGTT